MSSKEINESRANSINDTSREEVMLDFESLENITDELNFCSLFNDGESLKKAGIIGFAPVVAKEMIQVILGRGATLIYDSYIQTKIAHHSILRTFKFQELPIKFDMFTHDSFQTEFGLDSEPTKIETEKWRRLVIGSEKKDNKLEIEESEKQQFQDDQKSKTRSSFQGINFAKKTNQKMNADEKQFPEFNPLSVDLSKPVEFDHETETLRVLKDREMQMKYEKMIMDAQREKEMKEQQQRLRGAASDAASNKKIFTYDFDGRILPQNGIKLEKLPQTLQTLSHHILSEGILNKQSVNKQQQEQQALMKEHDNKKHKKSQMNIQYNNNTQQVYSSIKPESIMEQFELKEGVTLIQNGNVKEGPKKLHAMDAQSFAQIMSQAQQKIKLTKKEYEMLVVGGNLQRDQSSTKYNENRKTDAQQQQDNTFLNDFRSQQIHGESTILGKLNLNQSTRNHSIGSIKIENTKHLQSQLQPDNSEDQELKFWREKQNKFRTMHIKTEIDIKPSIIEDFNKTLLTHTHEVSSNKEYLMLPKIAQSTKPKTEEYRKTLGILSKLPRNRMSIIANQARSYTHLPPPGYGKVMGHGVSSGFNPNPSKDEKIESILEKLNNNSQIHYEQQTKK